MDLRLLILSIYIIFNGALVVDSQQNTKEQFDQISQQIRDAIQKLESQQTLSSDDQAEIKLYKCLYQTVNEVFRNELQGSSTINPYENSYVARQSSNKRNPSDVFSSGGRNIIPESSPEEYGARSYSQKNKYVNSESVNLENLSNEYDSGQSSYQPDSSRRGYSARSYPQESKYVNSESVNLEDLSNEYNSGQSSYQPDSSRRGYSARSYPQENKYVNPETITWEQLPNGYNSRKSSYETGAPSYNYGSGSYRSRNSYGAYPRDNTRRTQSSGQGFLMD